MQSGYVNPYVVADAPANERADFVRKTYAHLAGAVLAFAALEAFLMQTAIPNMMLGVANTRFGWFIVIGAFMLVSWIAQSWAQNGGSQGMQYVGLGLYVAAQGIIFTPLLKIAQIYDHQAISSAAVVTIALFLALTAIVVTTRKDFSFLGGILSVGMFVALGAIVASMVFNFPLPTVLFASVMVLFAGGAILYQTSQIMLNYRTDQPVAASLALFAAVAMLFWYVLQLFLSRRS